LRHNTAQLPYDGANHDNPSGCRGWRTAGVASAL